MLALKLTTLAGTTKCLVILGLLTLVTDASTVFRNLIKCALLSIEKRLRRWCESLWMLNETPGQAGTWSSVM
jgi:hypothetical protein